MYTLATRMQRFLANLVDGVILSLLSQVLSMAVGPTFSAEIIQDYSGNIYPIYEYNWLSIVLHLIVLNGLLIYFYRTAQSPGKAIMKMQVVDKETGEPVGMGRMFLREWVGKLVSGIVLAIGYLAILWDKNHQGWHDKIAKTVVVKKG